MNPDLLIFKQMIIWFGARNFTCQQVVCNQDDLESISIELHLVKSAHSFDISTFCLILIIRNPYVHKA